jgi:hypothetical protein
MRPIQITFRASAPDTEMSFFSILHCVAVKSAVFVAAALILASRLSVRIIRETYTKAPLLGGRAAG